MWSVQQDHPAQQDPLAPQVLPDQQDPLAPQDRPEQQDPLAPQAPPGQQGRSVRQAQSVQQDPPDQSAPLASLVLLEQPDQQALCQRAKSRSSGRITR